MVSYKYILLVISAELLCVTAHYEIAYAEDFCERNETAALNLGSDSSNSSGILKASRNNSYLPHQNCTIFIHPPLGFGVVLSVRYLDFRPYYPSSCVNYVEIMDDLKPTKLCGYSDDISEYQSYFSEGKALRINFVTPQSASENLNSDFTFIVTSYVKLNYECEMKMFQCQNSRCIWNGLTCDGHNNCGDQSDEFSNRMANCGALPAGIIAGIVVGSVIGFLLLIIIPFACCRCNSRYRSSRNDRNSPPLIQPTPSYGSAIAVVNPQEVEPQASGSSYPRCQDLPPAYKP